MSLVTFGPPGLEGGETLLHADAVTHSGDGSAVTPSSAGGRCLRVTTAEAGDPISTAGRRTAAGAPGGSPALPAGGPSRPDPTAPPPGGWGRTPLADLSFPPPRPSPKNPAV